MQCSSVFSVELAYLSICCPPTPKLSRSVSVAVPEGRVSPLACMLSALRSQHATALWTTTFNSTDPQPSSYVAATLPAKPTSHQIIVSFTLVFPSSSTHKLLLLSYLLLPSPAPFSAMCKWYCTSEGPSTNLACLHCHAHYCGACLHGDGGKMESLVKCASCGKKPRVQPKESRAGWKGESTSGSTAAGPAYTPSAALKQASAAGIRVSGSTSSSQTSSAKSSPKKSPTTAAAGKSDIFSRLTDTTLYTGTHQHRFDASGQGRGLEGRESVAKGAGGIPPKRTIDNAHVDLATILRPDPFYSPSTSDSSIAAKLSSPTKAKSTTASPKKAGPSVFSKLCDPTQYTGAHKARFDSNGNGRGMAGRDGASGIEYGGGRVSSLAQITRTNLR